MKNKTRIFLASILLLLTASVVWAQQTYEPTASADGYKQVSQDGFVFRWRIVGNEIEYSISGPTQGWVAIGFNPTNKMQDADYSIGFVKNGEVTLSDEFGVSPISHRSDDRLGGENDLVLIRGVEENGTTTLTMRRPLNTGDENDQVLAAGAYVDVIFAWGNNRADNLTSMHSRRGSFRVRL